ncbi:transposase [Mesorhizobium sp. B2-6-1]|nr:transposase [Mesorhizobium sp. B2-6-1]
MGEISDSFEAYGYRRMQAALRQRGIVVNHKKVRRLMREHDLQPRIRGASSPLRTAITSCRSSRTWRRT